MTKKAYFSIHAKPTNKEKPFFSTAKFQFRTATKLTCNHKFHPLNPTVSVQYNNPFSRVRNLASDVRLPFRTDSNPHRRYPETLQCSAWPVHDEGRSLQQKPRIERKFESQVAGRSRLLETWSPCSHPFAILPVSAVSDAQKLATGNFLHVRACFLVTFCTTQKVTTRSLCKEHRGCANLDSAHKDNSFAQSN